MGFFAKEKGGKPIGKVILLHVDDISPNPAQPRREFDPEALAGLADSIRLNGVLQPILVRKASLTDHAPPEKPYELIAGERRLRASKLAGKETIPAVVMDASTRQSAVYAILENIQRRDLNLFEEARALKTLIVEWGVTQEEAACKLGLSQPTIANKLRLLALSPAEQSLILEFHLTERHGRALLRLSPGESREKLTRLIGEKHLTVRETEELIERLLKGETAPDTPDTPDAPTVPDATDAPAPRKRVRSARKVMLVKDVRVFLNTVNQAIDAMKHAGIPAEATREDHGEYIEYLVRIPTHAAEDGKGKKSRARTG